LNKFRLIESKEEEVEEEVKEEVKESKESVAEITELIEIQKITVDPEQKEKEKDQKTKSLLSKLYFKRINQKLDNLDNKLKLVHPDENIQTIINPKKHMNSNIHVFSSDIKKLRRYDIKECKELFKIEKKFNSILGTTKSTGLRKQKYKH